MRDLIEDPYPTFTAVMMADLTARTALGSDRATAGGDFEVGRSVQSDHRARAQRDVLDICNCFNTSPSQAADMIEAIDRVEKIYASRSLSATNSRPEKE